MIIKIYNRYSRSVHELYSGILFLRLRQFIQMLSFDSNPNIKELHHLKTPTLIAWGQQDRVIPVHHAAKFAEDIPNSQTKIYSNCGHYPQVEYSNKFVEDWLSFAQGETPG